MPTRKFGHFRFLSERAKKPMVERRKAALFKKAKELSLLCDVEVAIIIYSPRAISSITWPSVDVAATRFIRFLNVPEAEKLKKMVLHENYLQDRVDAETEKVRKKERDLERSEINVLMNQVINGRCLKDLDAKQLKGLYVLAGEKMQELEKRKKDLLRVQNDGGDVRRHQTHRRATTEGNIGVSGGGSGSYYVPQPSAPLTFGSRLIGHLWRAGNNFVLPQLMCASLLVPTMAGPPLVHGGGSENEIIFYDDAESSSTNKGGRTIQVVGATASSSNTTFSQSQLSFSNQVWPQNFFP